MTERMDASLGRCSGNVPLGGDQEGDSGHAGRTMFFRLAWERFGMPPVELAQVAAERKVWNSMFSAPG